MAAKNSIGKPSGKAKKTAPAKVVAKQTPVAKKPAATRTENTVSKTATTTAARPAPKKTAAKPVAESATPVKEVVAKGIRKNPPAPPPVREETDGESSLLTGPRNVQPYIAQHGEQYMSKEQLEHFRNILQIWKQDLMEEVDRTVSHMKDEAANFPDPNDRATQEEEFSLELRTRDRERKLIRKIDEALKRIEDGSYGYCLETGEQIGIKRLEARPVATLSIEAQERRERREKQYGDRDDRYR
jgi:DnaK suppressor protein